MNQNSQKKTQSKQSTTTIDEKHTEMLNYFNHKHKNNLLSPSSLDAKETTKRKACFGKLP